MHEVDPAAVRQLAEEIILSRTSDIDTSTISESLDGYEDLTEENEEKLVEEVRELLDAAVVTVTFPGVESS